MLARRHHTTRPLTRYLALLAALTVLALLAAAPAARAAGWSAPVDVSGEGSNAYHPKVAVDAQGDAAAAWMQFTSPVGYAVEVSTRAAGGTWSTPQTLSSPGAGAAEPSIAIDPNGDAVVAWQQYVGSEEIEASTHAAGAATWSPSETLSFPGREATEAQAAIDSQGRAVVLFVGADAASNTIVQAAAEQGFGGTWGAPILLSAPGQNADEPTLGISAAGEAVAAWRRPNFNYNAIQASVRSPAGVWSAATNISSFGQSAREPHVAVDAAGDAAAIWSYWNGTTDIAQVVARPAGGSWGNVLGLTAPSENVREPHIAVNGAGGATAVWEKELNGEFLLQASSTPSPTGSWSPRLDLAPVMKEESELSLAADSNGDAVVTYSVRGNGSSVLHALNRSGATGPWSSPVAVADPELESEQGQVALTPSGRAVDIWIAAGSNGYARVQSATYDPPPAVVGGGESSGETPPSGGAPSGEAPSTTASASTPAPAPAASVPAPAHCPSGKSLRKVKVRVHAEGRRKPKFKTKLECVARKRKHPKHK